MKIKCKHCEEILTDEENGFRFCKCHKCFVDVNDSYWRVGGNPEYIDFIDKEIKNEK